IRDMEKLYPNHLKLASYYAEEMAHLFKTGPAISWMLSGYEPCGLNQMYSLRYGTIPVVHATGRLDDSVTDVLEYPDSGTGFKFYEYEPKAFLETLRSALELLKDAHKWVEI